MSSSVNYQLQFTNQTPYTLNILIDDVEYFRIKPQQSISKTTPATPITVGRWFRDGVIIQLGLMTIDPTVPYKIVLVDRYLYNMNADLMVDIKRKVGYTGPDDSPTIVVNTISLITTTWHQIFMSILIILTIIIISIIVSIITCFAYDKIKHKKM